MFSLADFPIGSYFYWIRTLNPQDSVAVYTRIQVKGHDSEGNLISNVENKRGHVWEQKFPKEKYLYPSNSFYIPESLYLQVHHPEVLNFNDPKIYLEKILLSGFTEQDRLIKMATLSFVEYDEMRKKHA